MTLPGLLIRLKRLRELLRRFEPIPIAIGTEEPESSILSIELYSRFRNANVTFFELVLNAAKGKMKAGW